MPLIRFNRSLLDRAFFRRVPVCGLILIDANPRVMKRSREMDNEMTNISWLRRLAQGALALSLVLIGIVAFSAAASAHDDVIAGAASCSSPLGTGYSVSWTISNDYDVSEAGSVTSVTGGLATLHATTFTVAAQDTAYASTKTSRAATLPYLTAVLTQKLPAGASGVITLTTNSTWADGVNVSDSGTIQLASLHCGGAGPLTGVVPTIAPIVQTIAGHIYLCNGTQPTATEVPGGTLASTGPQTFGSSPNPLPTTEVAPGEYVLTATPPPGYVLVVCGGTSRLASGGTTATAGITVPPGGNGVGIFYVTNSAPALTLVKSATEPSYDAAGQTINYNYLVTNTGNVTLSGVGVIDAHVGLTGLSCPNTILAPSSIETCSATYQVTAADLSAGSIINTATAQAVPPGTATPISSLPSSVTVPLGAIAIVKQVCGTEVAADCGLGGNGPWTSSVNVPQGDTAYWKVTVTNTGDTSLSNVTVTDPLVPGCDITGITLAVGASLATYCTTPDISATVVNVATISFAGQLPPFLSSSAQATESASPRTLPSVAPVVRVATSGTTDSLVPASGAPTVTG
jgi:uncharacterized repeat protein (TIGR01451 family)